MLRTFAAAIFALGLTGCEPAEEGRVLKLAHGLPTDHPVHAAMMHLAERVAEESGGALRVAVFPGEQLGSEAEALELVQLGILDMTKASAAPLEAFVPKMKVLGLPYLFRDDAHMWEVFEGEIGAEILAAGEARGLKGLCFYDAGARSFYTTGKLIRHPRDLVGMKIRVQKSEMAIAMIEAMGGSPTPIDWGELYSALQQGVVDGAENNRPSFTISRHYEVCRNYSLDEHLRQPDVLLMNPQSWASLSAEHQAILRRAVRGSVALQRRLWAAKAEASLAAVKADGVEVIEVDKAPFREAVKPLWERFEGTEIGELARRIQEVGADD